MLLLHRTVFSTVYAEITFSFQFNVQKCVYFYTMKNLSKEPTRLSHDQRFQQLIYRSRQLSRFNDVKKVRANFCETIDSCARFPLEGKKMKFLARQIFSGNIARICGNDPPFINIENVESAAEGCYFIKLHD